MRRKGSNAGPLLVWWRSRDVVETGVEGVGTGLPALGGQVGFSVQLCCAGSMKMSMPPRLE